MLDMSTALSEQASYEREKEGTTKSKMSFCFIRN